MSEHLEICFTSLSKVQREEMNFDKAKSGIKKVHNDREIEDNC
jgi:hypothetical protein